MKQKVLVVDDEKRNQRIITEILEDHAELSYADSGEQALAVAEAVHPDLIFLDIMMPGINGYEVCRKLKGDPRFAFCKIVLVSGKAMIEEKMQGYDCGADDYLTKPFVAEELFAKAKVFLRLAAVENELSHLNHSLEQKVEERTRQLLDTEGKLINSARLSALGEMAGGMAHEINTPLCAISLVADQINESIESDKPDLEELKQYVAAIQSTAGRIANIVQALRTFSRDGSNDRKETVAVAKVVQDTLVLCGQKFKYRSIDLRLASIPQDLVIACRPVQLAQVLLNLLNNACDAVETAPEKWVELSVVNKSNTLEISVTDNGSPIVQDVRAKLFQPFFTTKGVGKGTGLGLSISKGIVDAHGGSLTLDANCKNTRFVVSLPKVDAPQNTVRNVA